jgi:hypothetical protein
MVALRMKVLSGPENAPFNRLIPPSLLRDGQPGAELPAMVTEISRETGPIATDPVSP